MKPRKRRARRPDRHERLATGRPGTYIDDISAITAATLVWLWCRVSTKWQAERGNLEDQEAALRAAVADFGGTVVGVTRYTGRAWEAEAALYKAATCAARAGAVLLAESTSRFARHPDYHPKLRPHLVAGEDELRNLRFVCGEVTLVTMHPPDDTSGEERGHQSARGQHHKGNKGGRPRKKEPEDTSPGHKKRRLPMMLSKTFWFTFVAGLSVRDAADMLGEHHNQIQRWRDKLRGR